jgi:hypothetical protein
MYTENITLLLTPFWWSSSEDAPQKSVWYLPVELGGNY